MLHEVIDRGLGAAPNLFRPGVQQGPAFVFVVPEPLNARRNHCAHRCKFASLDRRLGEGMVLVDEGNGGLDDHAETVSRGHTEIIALAKPIRARDADITSDALKMVIDETHGYPYFLQEWGKHAWDLAESSPIDAGDVARASDEVAASLDAGFFRARFDRLTPVEKRYLRAMAEIGPGSHRSGEIARVLDRKVTSLGPTRAQLIAKGMIWSAARGDTAVTVPSFDRFMRRIMPGPAWRD